MNKTITAAILGFTLVLAGCGASGTADELVDYVNEDLQAFAQLEEEFGTMINNFGTSMNSATEDEIIQALNEEALPALEEKREFVQSIELEYEDVQQLNALLIDAVEHKYDAMQIEIEGLEQGDQDLLTESGELLEASDNLKLEFNAMLEDVADQHNVELGDE
ncbi:hypothetical protein ACE1TF_05895 [Geomicrobium sp. JSM 1781026]|uniref:hypothetical protein n=1 Tax=Geomicrobium sp. JSM 1781026 TaxID=3344580 RepID=UPI0035BF7265